MPFLLDYPLEDFRNVLNTNLIAFFAIKKALPAMIENGGSIINVTSDAGVTAIQVGAMASPNLDSKDCRRPGQQNLEESNVASIGLIQ